MRHESKYCGGTHEDELSLLWLLSLSLTVLLCTGALANVAKLSEHVSLKDREWIL